MQSPPELRSHNGVLEVSLHFKYQVTFAGQGPPRYCYVTDDGLESPTLRLHPGDRLIIHFHNDLAPAGPGLPADQGTVMNDCAAMAMTASMTNLHFHGLTVPPTCHQDDVIRTAILPVRSSSIGSRYRQTSRLDFTGIIRIRTVTPSGRCKEELLAR